MQLGDLFDLSLVARAGAVGLDYDDGHVTRALTFGDVDARARRMATVLRSRGLRPGDRLAVHLANRVEYLDLFVACVRLGVVFVPVNVLYREREIGHIVSDAEPALAVTSAGGRTFFPAGAPAIEIEPLAAEAEAATPDVVHTVIDGDAAVAIVYTSGTTGRSKGAVLTHNNILANTANLVAAWCITSSDRYLAVLPLFHVHGLVNGVCTWLATGCRMRLVERFDHARAADWFADFAPTLFFGVPTIYVRLLELSAPVAARIGAGMRLFVSGSAPLPAHVLEAFRALFGHTILERYGMSETLMNTSNPYAGERRAGTVGFPLPGVSLRIADESGAPAGDGTVGEVQVRGPNVFQGYWRNPEATTAAFTERWFRTGDLGERSPDGYLTLRGRRTELIISGGFNIYPREVEDVLLEQPGVREAAVIGAPDERRGEVPVAYVVTDGAFDGEALRAACGAALASFKVPRSCVRVDSLPRNALGKVQKHLLPRPREG